MVAQWMQNKTELKISSLKTPCRSHDGECLNPRVLQKVEAGVGGGLIVFEVRGLPGKYPAM